MPMAYSANDMHTQARTHARAHAHTHTHPKDPSVLKIVQIQNSVSVLNLVREPDSVQKPTAQPCTKFALPPPNVRTDSIFPYYFFGMFTSSPHTHASIWTMQAPLQSTADPTLHHCSCLEALLVCLFTCLTAVASHTAMFFPVCCPFFCRHAQTVQQIFLAACTCAAGRP